MSKVVQALAPWGGGWVGECSCSVVQKNRVWGGGLVAANRVCKCVCVGGGGWGGYAVQSPMTISFIVSFCVVLKSWMALGTKDFHSLSVRIMFFSFAH